MGMLQAFWLSGRPSTSLGNVAAESCGVCGGDGLIGNVYGQTKRCPSCHGTGRRSDDGGSLLRDVTKTKASHHKPTNRAETVQKPQWPSTFEGEKLANEVKGS